jgi:hypothetical protein
MGFQVIFVAIGFGVGFLFYNLVSALAVDVSGLGLVVIHSTEVGKLVSLKLHWI